MNYVCFPHSSCFVSIFFWCCSSFTKDQKASFRNNVYAFVFHFAEMFVKLCLFLFFTTDFFPAIYVTNILWNSVLHGCHLNKITISHTALVFCANMSVNVYLRNVSKSREQQTSLCFYQFDLATSFYYDYFFGGSNKK